jgi:hypothetical protein
VAVKVTLPLTAGFKFVAPTDTVGFWFPVNAPRFTWTSIQRTPEVASVPRRMGVM